MSNRPVLYRFFRWTVIGATIHAAYQTLRYAVTDPTEWFGPLIIGAALTVGGLILIGVTHDA